MPHQLSDNHYIPMKNAHIDTNDFEEDILVDIGKYPNFNDGGKLAKLIYDKILKRIAKQPTEPKDDAL
ncbi:MAG: hypothetical protein KZQ84_20505 [Candidatus Thiodiazotropha sp. (ex Lucinoma borealis)]|nr:hypothetical protein [Candidatus Thiodiazotropha sp. (ex Lucinoma borealis)]